jgi:hypothetical protein
MPLPQRLPSQLTYNDLNGDEAVEILCDWFRQLLRTQPLMQPHLTLPMAVLTLDVRVGVDMYVGGTVPVDSPPEHLDITGNVELNNRIPDARGSGRRAVETAKREPQHTEHELHAEINAAPIPGGQPPDQVRDRHGLPVPRPGYGPRETGSHLFLADLPDLNADIHKELQRVVPPAPDATGGRRGEVADGYVFSAEAVNQPSSQHIPVHNGAIDVELTGNSIRHDSGVTVTAGTHVASKKTLGDQGGKPYSSVNGVYDPGPAGLMRPGGGGGLGADGRPRISFGNSHRG